MSIATGRLLWLATELGEDKPRAGNAFLVIEVPIQVARDASPLLGEQVDVREAGAVPCSTAELVAVMRGLDNKSREAPSPARCVLTQKGERTGYARAVEELRALAGLDDDWREGEP